MEQKNKVKKVGLQTDQEFLQNEIKRLKSLKYSLHVKGEGQHFPQDKK